MKRILSIRDELPTDGRADVVGAVAATQRPDGSASLATQAIGVRAVEVYSRTRAKVLVLTGGARVVPVKSPVDSSGLPPGYGATDRPGASGAAGITEARALRTVVSAQGVTEDIILDEAVDHCQGTHRQAASLAAILRRLPLGGPGSRLRVILVAHPRHLPRALWLFRRSIPGVDFFAVNAAEVYDPTATRWRLRARGFFCFWNLVAWMHHLLFVPRPPRPATVSVARQD